MIILLIKDFILCAIATAFFALLMNVPKRCILTASLLASAGYAVYQIIYIGFKHEVTGYFAGTLLIAVIGEYLARRMKTPSLIFVFPAIVPLVPGIGIYRTMLLLVEEDYNGAMRMGVKTVLIAGAMAVAIAFTNLIARQFFSRKRQ